MAVQPTLSKPGLPTQRQSAVNPVLAAHMMRPTTPLWVPLMMIFVTALSVAALALTLLKGAPETADATPAAASAPTGIQVESPELVEEGKLMQVKVVELERALGQSKLEIQRLKEELLNVRSSVDGLNANVALVQSQVAKTQAPVNIQPSQPDN